jgi:hypothetical protein
MKEKQQWSLQEGLRTDVCLFGHKIHTEDIVEFLSEPIKSRRGGMIFPISFSGLHVC